MSVNEENYFKIIFIPSKVNVMSTKKTLSFALFFGLLTLFALFFGIIFLLVGNGVDLGILTWGKSFDTATQFGLGVGLSVLGVLFAVVAPSSNILYRYHKRKKSNDERISEKNASSENKKLIAQNTGKKHQKIKSLPQNQHHSNSQREKKITLIRTSSKPVSGRHNGRSKKIKNPADTKHPRIQQQRRKSADLPKRPESASLLSDREKTRHRRSMSIPTLSSIPGHLMSEFKAKFTSFYPPTIHAFSSRTVPATRNQGLSEPFFNGFSHQIEKCIAGQFNRGVDNKQSLLLIDRDREAQSILRRMVQNLSVLERLQYLSPPWKFDRILAQTAEEKNIVRIEYNTANSNALSDLHKQTFTKYSLAIRKLSILCGILTLLEYPGYLTYDLKSKQAIKNDIAKLANEIAKNAHNTIKDPKGEIDNFTVELVKNIAKTSCIRKKDATRQIREAERYFIADYNQNNVLMVIIPYNNEQIIQLDVGLNHQLTEKQKQDYMQIHNQNNEPGWFKPLSSAEQAWYLKRIPKQLKPPREWHAFERLFKSSAMQHTPGIANARVNYLMCRDHEGNIQILSKSIKTASPVTYEMPPEEVKTHARRNTEQLIQIAKHIAQDNFNVLWGDFFRKKKIEIKIPILFQSLLSAEIKKFNIGFIEADQVLIDHQRLALVGVTLDNAYEMMYHNSGTNAFALPEQRKKKEIEEDAELKKLLVFSHCFIFNVLSALSEKSVVQSNVFCLFHHATQCIDVSFLHTIISQINTIEPFTEKQKYSLKTIVLAVNELKKLSTTKAQMGRNKAEYLIALKKILVEAMGGVVTNNCKSGKDRTGQSELYQNALTLVALANDGQFPSYADKSALRKQFCEILADLNMSTKHYKAAELNTLGSLGTKASSIAMIIDDEVIITGDFSRFYGTFCRLATMNKPTIFVDDEARKAEELKRVEEKLEGRNSDSDSDEDLNSRMSLT